MVSPATSRSPFLAPRLPSLPACLQRAPAPIPNPAFLVILVAGKVTSHPEHDARMLDMHSVKPIDHDALERASRDTGAFVVAVAERVLTRK
jgi:hypothetical protein